VAESPDFLNAARILLVDDDPIMRELAAERLLAGSHKVFCASDGAEAYDRLATEQVDLVISDLDMPSMNGYELTQRIRETPALADLPIIVITASDQGEAVDQAFAAGATSFLAKPMNWTLFNQAVLFVLRASRDQKALKIALSLAEAGAKFKDGLMSVMSHELRTPLNAIIGFGKILSEQFERERDLLHKEYADYVVDGGNRLLNSVQDMLLASEARSGAIAINEVDCTVGELVDFAKAATAKVAGLADAELATAVENPDQEICCDRNQVSRAIAKLIDNSVKFSQRGVKIVVGAARNKAGDLAILVKDNGPGIAPERLAAITQPFAQSDMSLKRSKEGLGLGLLLVQAIASAHGAKFRLDSKPGEGVRALLLFPASRLIASRSEEPSVLAGAA
jgi:signal transduction histidine kinase